MRVDVPLPFHCWRHTPVVFGGGLLPHSSLAPWGRPTVPPRSACPTRPQTGNRSRVARTLRVLPLVEYHAAIRWLSEVEAGKGLTALSAVVVEVSFGEHLVPRPRERTWSTQRPSSDPTTTPDQRLSFHVEGGYDWVRCVLSRSGCPTVSLLVDSSLPDRPSLRAPPWVAPRVPPLS